MQFARQTLDEAAATVIYEELVHAGGDGGVVAVDAQGNVALVFNTAGMYRASIDSTGQKQVGIYGTAP
jgi:beta-aspartyl-peptidase (threonine type)